MSIFQAIIIAIVEGLTEFLPVSSTGHMILAQGFLGVKSDDFVKAFTVIIQFGAIISVLVLYWKRFFQLKPIKIFDKSQVLNVTGFSKWMIYLNRFLNKYDFYWKLLVAFLPAAVIGFLAGDFIDSLLENVWVVAIMLVLGGVFMLFVDKWFTHPQETEPEMTFMHALKIGFAQCVAMIPGVSRSMATIVGGMAQGFSRKTAAEFSFFLAVPTMAAASGYKLLKLWQNDATRSMLSENMNILIVGNVVAFIVAMFAIKFFINFLTKYGFKAFGYYRIVAGLAIILLLVLGYNLEVA